MTDNISRAAVIELLREEYHRDPSGPTSELVLLRRLICKVENLPEVGPMVSEAEYAANRRMVLKHEKRRCEAIRGNGVTCYHLAEFAHQFPAANEMVAPRSVFFCGHCFRSEKRWTEDGRVFIVPSLPQK